MTRQVRHEKGPRHRSPEPGLRARTAPEREDDWTATRRWQGKARVLAVVLMVAAALAALVAWALLTPLLVAAVG